MSTPTRAHRQSMEAVVVPTRRLSLVSTTFKRKVRATSEADSDYTPSTAPALISSSVNRGLRKRHSLPVLKHGETIGRRSRSASVSSRKRRGVDKGKGRAIISRKSSRSSWVSSFSTLPIRSRRSFDTETVHRDSSVASGPIAGPSGSHDDDMDTPEANAATEATFALLAAAADFVEDADAAVQILEDGSILAVGLGQDLEMANLEDAVKREVEVGEADENMVEDQLPPIHIPEKQVWEGDAIVAQEPREQREGEENECVICATDIVEVCTTAEEAGLGGLGGSLAVWVCEQQACGAVFCISCALEWANRAIQNRLNTTCPQCTRPTDIDALRAQAKAYNPNGPEDPINAPPPLPVLRNRYTLWIDHFFTIPANQPPAHNMIVPFLEQFLAEGIAPDHQANQAILAIHTRNAIIAWMSYWTARGIAPAQIGFILPQQYVNLMAAFQNQLMGPQVHRMDMAPEVILPNAPERAPRRVPRGRRVPPHIQEIIDRLRELANAPGLLQNAIAVRTQTIDSLQQIANLGPGALGGGVALNRLVHHVEGPESPIEKFTRFVQDTFNNADGIQALLNHLYGTPEERERMGNMIRHERQGRQALTRLQDLPGLRQPPFNLLRQVQARPGIGRAQGDGVIPFPGRFLPDRRRIGPHLDEEVVALPAVQAAAPGGAGAPEPVQVLQQQLAQLDEARNDVLRRLQRAQAAQAAAPPVIFADAPPPAPAPVGGAADQQLFERLVRMRDQFADLAGPRQQERRRQARAQEERIREAIARMGDLMPPALAEIPAAMRDIAVRAPQQRRVRMDLNVQEIPAIPARQARRVRLDLDVQEIPDGVQDNAEGAGRVLRRRGV